MSDEKDFKATRATQMTSALGFRGVDEFADQAQIPLKTLNLTFLEYLFQFFRQTEIHDRGNMIFDKALDNLMRTIEIFRRQEDVSAMEFSFKGEQFYVNGNRIRVQGRQVRSNRFLVRYIRKRLIGKISFPSGISKEKLGDYFWTISSALDESKEDPAGAVEEYIKAQNDDRFFIEKALFKSDESFGRERLGTAEDLELASLAIYERLKDYLKICFDNLEHSERFPKIRLGDLFNDLVNLQTDDLLQVVRLRLMRPTTDVYPTLAADVSFALMAWAKALGLPFGVAADVARAGMTHTIIYLVRGKVDYSRVSDDEVARVFENLELLKSVWELETVHKLVAMEWTQDYGEMGVYETSGTKCFAHFFSRMTRIVAVFRALTINKGDGAALLPDEAMTELIQLDKALDPSLVKIFVNWMGIYPVGSLIELQSGEVAQVFAGASDPMRFKRPVVSILKDSEGKLLERPQLMDLNEMNEKLGVYRKSIKRSLKTSDANIPEETFKLAPIGLQ